MGQNSNQDYSVFGGWLLVWYWCLIIGAAGLALSSVLSLVSSLFLGLGLLYFIGSLIWVLASLLVALLYIQTAVKMKKADVTFFDNYFIICIVYIAANLVSNILMGVGLGGFISSIVSYAVGMVLYIMYFSKSKRVATYFPQSPVKASRFSSIIEKLPDFITSAK